MPTCSRCQGDHIGSQAVPLTHPTLHSRFQDKEWIRPNDRGHFPTEFMKFQEVPVEAVDASGCAINYQGMSNLCK